MRASCWRCGDHTWGVQPRWALEECASRLLCLVCREERAEAFRILVFREQSLSWFRFRCRFRLAWWNAGRARQLLAYQGPAPRTAQE